MKRIHLLSPLGCLAALALMIPSTTRAAALLLDFGPTTVLEADATKSPAHALGAIPASEISWNKVQADGGGLVYSDGSAATGVSIDLGRSQVDVDTVDFDDNAFNAGLTGSQLTAGIYSGTSPIRDGMFPGATGADNRAVGARIDGLPAGTHTIYVVGRNSNSTEARPQRFYFATGPSASTYSFSLADANVLVSNPSPAVTTGFIEGNNYGVATMTLAAGESLYIATEGTGAPELRGFFNTIQILAGIPTLPAQITVQPASRSVHETANAVFVAGASGSEPLLIQWRFEGTDLVDGPNITGANTDRLVLRSVTPEMAGAYSLFVSNEVTSELSSEALLTVSPVLNTAQMTNIWNLSPGDRPYLGTGATERGLAYNRATENLLLASRLGTNIVVLDPATGAEKHLLNMSGVAGGTLGLNMVGAGDDGVVYAANLTTTATSPPLKIYRWENDSAESVPVEVFIGDPGDGMESNLRWGDNMAVRGAGANTQILMAPGGGTNVALLRTASGFNFQTEIPPAVIAVSDVPSGFARLGVAFGPGENTFWAKAASGLLYLIEFDLNSNTGTVLKAYPATLVPGSVRGIGVSDDQQFLAGISVEPPIGDKVNLYDVSDLEIGPLLRDQEAFITQNPNVQSVGAVAFGGDYLFALGSDNGIKAFLIDTNYVPPSVSIVSHPADRTVMAGASAIFSAVAASTEPVNYQWRFNDVDLADGDDISGANSDTLTVRNVTAEREGNYSVFASNAFGSALSSEAVLTIVPTFNTPQMTNIWSVLAGERVYLGTGSTERGLAYNPVTTNLLLVSRSPSESVVVLDALTGAEKHFLDVTGVGGTTAGQVLGLNTIGIADDGVVFAANLTVNPESFQFFVYRWSDDAPGNPPLTVFQGDPGFGVQAGLRWSDVMAVRGSGADTQILISPGSGTNVVLLRSTSGFNFQTEIPPAVIAVSGVPSGFAQNGIAFGPGANTFWAKTVNGQLYLIEFDLNSNTGTVLQSYGSDSVPANLRSISAHSSQTFLAGIARDVNPNVQIFDISNLAAGPVLRDQEPFDTQNPNVTLGGVGATVFGGDYLFAVDANNGITAFLIDFDFVPVTEFSITGIVHIDGSVVFTWPSVVGQNYQVQSRESLSTGDWSDVGGVITATESTTSFTESIAGAAKFYRVQAQ